MKISRLLTGLLGLFLSALPRVALADPTAAQPPGSAPPSVPPPETPATSGPAVVPAAAAPTSPPELIAEGSSSRPPQAGRIDLSTPPPAPAVQRAYHMHEGFYLRASVGVGLALASLDDKHPSGDRLQGFAASLDANLMVGGSPSPGLAIGGAFIAETASVGFERDDIDVYDRSVALFMVGPFIDAFPNASRGWHFGGTVGFAHHSFGSTGFDDSRNANGIGGAFWLGHDFWVADEWSFGPLLKLAGAATKGSDPDTSASSFSASLLFTGLYH